MTYVNLKEYNKIREVIMKYDIEKSQKPKYLQIYKQIKNDIISNAYPFNAKLPSKRILSEELSVSVITIEHAYELLLQEGYIESKAKSGYYVIYKQDDFISQEPFEDDLSKTYIDKPAFHNDNLFPFSVLTKTMRKVILDYGENLLNKSHYKGCLSFRKAICQYLKRSVGIDAVPEQVVVGAGAEYLYSLIIQLIGKDKTYAIENPSYEKIEKVYTANGIKIEKLSLGANGIKTHELNNSTATVLHTTPYNSYPSLITASASKRQEYLQWAKNKNGFIIEDNYDSELTVSKKHEETLYSLTKCDSVFYVNTFSKTISPSLRVGYLVLPKNMVDKFDKNLSFYSCTVPVFEQYLIENLITSGEFERHVNRVRRKRRKNI